MEFQKKYNELKAKSYDIAVRISDLEISVGHDNASVFKLKKLFSKLQSAINFSFYYNQHRMEKESRLHMDYAFKLIDFIYSALERVEVPKSRVELKLENPEKKAKTGRLRIKLNSKQLLIFVALGLAYCLFMYFFFIRGRL